MAQLIQKKSKGGHVAVGRVLVKKPATGSKWVGQGSVIVKVKAS